MSEGNEPSAEGDGARPSGEKVEALVETEPTKSVDEQADAIIRKHMNYSMVGGAIPIPVLDLTALTAVQLDLAKQLAKLYGIPFDSGSSRAFLTSLGSAMTGRMLARLGAASIAKLIPGVGALAGVAAGVTLNGAFTYAVGHVVKSHFSQGLPLDELDAGRVRDEFGKLYDAGKQQAKDLYDKVTRAKPDAESDHE